MCMSDVFRLFRLLPLLPSYITNLQLQRAPKITSRIEQYRMSFSVRVFVCTLIS
uniref:Uncharacterized protein n=1 Tax=Arundo donax TaxID=35708 RepID=A0A0A9CMC2_ARUDO